MLKAIRRFASSARLLPIGGSKPSRRQPREPTAAELSERAAGYTAMAVTASTDQSRETWKRLALRYTALAAERRMAGRQAAHCQNRVGAS